MSNEYVKYDQYLIKSNTPICHIFGIFDILEKFEMLQYAKYVENGAYWGIQNFTNMSNMLNICHIGVLVILSLVEYSAYWSYSGKMIGLLVSAILGKMTINSVLIFSYCVCKPIFVQFVEIVSVVDYFLNC